TREIRCNLRRARRTAYFSSASSDFKVLGAFFATLGNSQAGGARRIAVGTALALTDYPWSLARLAAAEIADGAR
ncbi:MAG TPA: hypothetical protein VJ251_21125, partial [Stellaceae bacterium]|nr:hypothetical protein [Stellaceae bacterium]